MHDAGKLRMAHIRHQAAIQPLARVHPYRDIATIIDIGFRQIAPGQQSLQDVIGNSARGLIPARLASGGSVSGA